MYELVSAATGQFKTLLYEYDKFLPPTTFPYIPLLIAAIFQVFAWFGGRFLGAYSIIPRTLILWLFSLGEYGFMSPAMNMSVELLGMHESLLVVVYHVITLSVFIFVNSFVFGNPFEIKYLISYCLLIAATWIAFRW